MFADADFDAGGGGIGGGVAVQPRPVLRRRVPVVRRGPIFDEFTAAVAEAAAKAKIGPGLDPTTELGPLVSQEQFDKVSGYLPRASPTAPAR